MKDTSTIRRHVEMQGLTDPDDEALAAVYPWLRMAPGVQLVGLGIGVVAASASIVWTMASLALAAALFRAHPIDTLYNHGVCRLSGRRRLPPCGAPRRFAFFLESAWLVAAGWAFHQGAIFAGYILCSMMFAALEYHVLTGFCLGSWLYGRNSGRKQRRNSVPAPSAMFER